MTSSHLIVSPYDTGARYSEKHGRSWLGYKAHLTETVTDPAEDDPATGTPAVPNLITHVATTPAAVTDVEMTRRVHDALDAAGLLPAEHAVDSGYVSGDLLAAAARRGLTLLGPLLADNSAQARTGGYTQDAFTIDWDSEQVTCPQGQVSRTWSHSRAEGRPEMILIQFAAATCKACPVKSTCTSSARSGRQLGLRPRQVHEAVAAARAGQDTQSWKDRYKTRAGAEGTMAQAAHVTGIRRARYTGLARTTFEHAAAAAALNLIRLDAWWTAKPLDRSRTTHLQRLSLAA